MRLPLGRGGRALRGARRSLSRKPHATAHLQAELYEVADALLAPHVARAGWAGACFRLQDVAGDAGAPDTLLLVLHGARGGRAPACLVPRENRGRAASFTQLSAVARDARDAIRTAPRSVRTGLVRNAAQMVVTNGYGGELSLVLK